uniref:tRNA(Phe) (4-demethylwyosine(37)-C(7)) aminocarboxypropyltransferase n=1 Tax=Geoglobus ahangari TaxID=113653 RepID=A0A7C3UL47_9EURY
MKALKVPKPKAEEVRKFAEKIGAKDKSRKIRVEGDYVIIPIKDGFEDKFDFEVVEDKSPVFKGNKSFKEIVEKIAGFYPKYADFKRIGDLAIIKLPKELMEFKYKIAEEIFRNYKVRAIWLDRGKKGMLRKPEMELLIGEGSETIHTENNCKFKLDVTKVMFSLGNQFEKMRVAKLVEDGEIVLDMFAGIGYFSIPVAKHSKAKRIYAIEINWDAYTYLLENIKLNNVKNIIPVLGDSKQVTPEDFADRVIMGHIFAEDFIPTAIKAIRDEGVIHYHESTPVKVIDRPIRRIKYYAEKMGASVEIIGFRKVKNYAPNVYHVVVDAKLRKSC